MPAKAAPKINRLCERCSNKCKQLARVTIVSCPDFEAKPVQMEIPLKIPRSSRKKLRP